MAEESQRQVDSNETPNPMKSVLDELAKLRKENERLNGRLDELVQSVQQPSARKSLFSKKRMQATVDPSCSDAVRKTYKELKKQKEDFDGFKTDVRYDDEENKKIEVILVKEVRGNFGKKKWPKAEIKGAVFQYWRSTRDDMVRQKNGKLEEHRVLTRRRLRTKRKLMYRKEVIDKAELSLDDKAKMKALLNLRNAVEFISSEESEDNEEGTSGPPPRFIKPLRWERSKLRNIKAVLDASYEARKSKRQKRTAAKITRKADQNMSDRPVPTNCPSWAGRQ